MKFVIIIILAFVLLIPIPIFAPSHPEYVEDEWTWTEYQDSFD